MYSLLDWILSSKNSNLTAELYVTFGILAFIVVNLLITIYSREFSEDIGTKDNPDLWIQRRSKASGRTFFQTDSREDTTIEER